MKNLHNIVTYQYPDSTYGRYDIEKIRNSEKNFFWNFKKVVSSFAANGPKMRLKMVLWCCPPDGLATGPNTPLNEKLP